MDLFEGNTKVDLYTAFIVYTIHNLHTVQIQNLFAKCIQ